MSNVIQFVVYSIFVGTTILVPALFVANLFEFRYSSANKVLVQSVNRVILLGSFLFIIMIFSKVFTTLFSGAEYEQYVFSNRSARLYWFEFGMPLFNCVLLPQVLWIRKFRKTIISSTIIVAIWCLLYWFLLAKILAVPLISFVKIEFTRIDCLEQMFIYLAILSCMYFVLLRRKVLVNPASNEL